MGKKTFFEVKKEVKGAVDKAFTADKMRTYGEIAVDLVVRRTRSGFGVKAEGQSKRRLKPLAPSTVEQRKRLAAKGKLSSETSPARSNLTRSGDMLDSVKVVAARKGFAKIAPSGTNPDGEKNDKVAEYAEESGRPFLYLSDQEKKKVDAAVDAEIQTQLKRI